ncbi:MAG: hypothetical protein H6621_02115 [Halobacteriovoraceae bacterium]|nr:hypothetical protein [Halobacteriovoraceae bacterium]MCB9093838.1 hypothetical protein [Halobacteriovoraceae bacterium]
MQILSIIFAFFVTFLSTAQASDCVIVFDAGSSGTRLYAFEETEGAFKNVFDEEKDIGVSWALERKQCGDHVCTYEDIENVVEQLLMSFHYKKTGSCSSELKSVSLYATGGMRLAEQKVGVKKVEKTFKDLESFIYKKLINMGEDYFNLSRPGVSARIISGSEEGIYTLLSINELHQNKTLKQGTIEMGGSSVQLAYLCTEFDEDCLDQSTPVNYKGQTYNIFSYSFLGLGRNEAFRILSTEKKNVCEHIFNKKWRDSYDLKQCQKNIKKVIRERGDRAVIKDFLNFRSVKAHSQGRRQSIEIPVGSSFHAVGGFGYVDFEKIDANIAEICPFSEDELLANQKKYSAVKYTPEYLVKSECFANIYYKSFIEGIPNLNIESNARKIGGTKVSWVLGAALCDATKCLDKSKLLCRWRVGWQCQK